MARRLLVAALALAVATGACTGDDGDRAADASDSSSVTGGRDAPTTTGTYARWTVTETADGLEVDAGSHHIAIATEEGLGWRVTDAAGADLVADAPAGGLFIVRDGVEHRVRAVTDTVLGADHATFEVSFGAAGTGKVELAAEGDRGLVVRVSPDAPGGVTAWGTELALQPDELIYGLTERIVDDWNDSENVPAEVGSLDRRGEDVTMEVRPTMSGYAPFHQSSAGYGLLVDGYLPGTYAIGTDDPDVLSLRFELDPSEQAGVYHLLLGKGHAAILQQYYELAGYPRQPPDTVFQHWRGRDELPVGEAVEVDGVAMNASVAADLEAYERYDLPAGIYHFDRPWAVGSEGYGELRFDPERFPNAEAMLATLVAAGWSNEVWMAPWALDERGEEAAANGWLAPGSARAIDLTDPEAVAWLQADVADFLASPEGQHIDGFFLDRGDEPDVPSTEQDVYADGRNGRQIHNWYPVEYARVFRQVLDDARRADGWLIARPGYTGSQQHTMRWGGDTRSREGLAIPEAPVELAPSTDLGLRSVLISMQRAAFMGTPYWGSDIGGYTAWVDREVYARWIEVGFASPLMRFHGMGGTPWATTVTGAPDPELIEIYRRYVLLRHDPDVQAYLSVASEEAATSGIPMVRPLVWAWPDEAGALDRWDQWLLGPDLLVAPVWRSGARERTVWIPPGAWVDFWDRGEIVDGPTELTVDAPLGELPMWIRSGSPLEAVEPVE